MVSFLREQNNIICSKTRQLDDIMHEQTFLVGSHLQVTWSVLSTPPPPHIIKY